MNKLKIYSDYFDIHRTYSRYRQLRFSCDKFTVSVLLRVSIFYRYYKISQVRPHFAYVGESTIFHWEIYHAIAWKS